MNHTKKMAAGLLALLPAGGVLAGCGGQSREDAIGALTNTETPTAAAKATPTANAEDEFEAGVCTDTEYTNAWIGLKFTATDDMTMQTKEQIQDSQEAGAELLQVEQSSNANVVTEMAAVTPEGNNINISAVKDQSGVITPSMYVRQMENALEAQTGENVSYEFGDPSQRTVAGVEFETLDLRCTIEQNGQEFTMNQTMLVCKKGNWLYQMVISYFEDDALETFLACFSAV